MDYAARRSQARQGRGRRSDRAAQGGASRRPARSPALRRWRPPGRGGAPASPLNTRIGPHRRFAWVESELDRFKAIKGALGGTINDVVLAVVTGALRDHLERRGRDPAGLELKAMVPVSVRAEEQRGELGNQVAAMYAPLPVGLADPLERFRAVHEALGDLK